MRERFAKATSNLRRSPGRSGSDSSSASDGGPQGAAMTPPVAFPPSYLTSDGAAPNPLRLDGSTPGNGAAGDRSNPGSVSSNGAHEATGSEIVDLEHRRAELQALVAELQWDLGGLVYEMATRDRIRVDILVKRAAVLQDADSELAEVERILRMEQTATAGACTSCGAPHSSGAAFCWQCGNAILRQVDTASIMAP